MLISPYTHLLTLFIFYIIKKFIKFELCLFIRYIFFLHAELFRTILHGRGLWQDYLVLLTVVLTLEFYFFIDFLNLHFNVKRLRNGGNWQTKISSSLHVLVRYLLTLPWFSSIFFDEFRKFLLTRGLYFNAISGILWLFIRGCARILLVLFSFVYYIHKYTYTDMYEYIHSHIG